MYINKMYNIKNLEKFKIKNKNNQNNINLLRKNHFNKFIRRIIKIFKNHRRKFKIQVMFMLYNKNKKMKLKIIIIKKIYHLIIIFNKINNRLKNNENNTKNKRNY
jgi:hypothetical protein